MTEPTEDQLREQADYFIVSIGGSSTKVLHLPDSHRSRRDDPTPLCRPHTDSYDWDSKDIQVYPPGFLEICQQCRWRTMKK